MASFATVEDVEARQGETFDPTQTIQVQSYLDAATAIIKAETAQVIEQVPDDDLDTWGQAGAFLPLPQWPVTAVASVTLGGAAVGDYVLRKRHLYRGSGWGGILVPIAVTYTHGYETIPELVKNTTMDVAMRGYALAGAGSGVIRSERIGQYSVTYQTPNGQTVWLAGDELQRLRKLLGVPSAGTLSLSPSPPGTGDQPDGMLVP